MILKSFWIFRLKIHLQFEFPRNRVTLGSVLTKLNPLSDHLYEGTYVVSWTIWQRWSCALQIQWVPAFEHVWVQHKCMHTQLMIMPERKGEKQLEHYIWAAGEQTPGKIDALTMNFIVHMIFRFLLFFFVWMYAPSICLDVLVQIHNTLSFMGKHIRRKLWGSLRNKNGVFPPDVIFHQRKNVQK